MHKTLLSLAAPQHFSHRVYTNCGRDEPYCPSPAACLQSIQSREGQQLRTSQKLQNFLTDNKISYTRLGVVRPTEIARLEATSGPLCTIFSRTNQYLSAKVFTSMINL